MSKSPTGRRQVSSMPNLQQIPINSPEAKLIKDAFLRRCRICSRLLDRPGDPLSQDCGGDCLKCMADAGDPGCIAIVDRIAKSDLRYTPAFRQWLHEVQVELGSEVEIDHAWEIYDDGASVQDAVAEFRDSY